MSMLWLCYMNFFFQWERFYKLSKAFFLSTAFLNTFFLKDDCLFTIEDSYNKNLKTWL